MKTFILKVTGLVIIISEAVILLYFLLVIIFTLSITT